MAILGLKTGQIAYYSGEKVNFFREITIIDRFFQKSL